MQHKGVARHYVNIIIMTVALTPPLGSRITPRYRYECLMGMSRDIAAYGSRTGEVWILPPSPAMTTTDVAASLPVM